MRRAQKGSYVNVNKGEYPLLSRMNLHNADVKLVSLIKASQDVIMSKKTSYNSGKHIHLFVALQILWSSWNIAFLIEASDRDGVVEICG